MTKAGIVRRMSQVLGPVVGGTIFIVAVWILHKELRHFHYRDVVRQVRAIPHLLVLASFALMVANYLLLTLYDVLALRYLNRPLPYRRIALASFTSYVFSHNIGLGVISSGAVRYRLYSLWGLSALEVGKIVIFSAVTFWLGILALSGAVFLVRPLEVPVSLRLPSGAVPLAGVLFVLLVLAYLALGSFWHRPVVVRTWEFHLPRLPIRLAQVGVAMVDWALVAGTLYVLLPDKAALPISHYLAIYMFAQIAAFISHAPGGLGVFDGLFLLMMRPYLPAEQVVGALVAYRAIYYLIPLIAAALLLGGYEVYLRREMGRRMAAAVTAWAPESAPMVFAVVAFVAGVLLLFSGVTPAVPDRLQWLLNIIPPPVLDASHFLSSVAGMALILVARSLQRRIEAAYYCAAALLSAGVVLALARGLDYVEAGILALLLAALVPCRPAFTRRASLLREPFTLGWTVAVVAVLVATAWLAMFSQRRLADPAVPWWDLAFDTGEAPRAVRGFAGAAALAFVFTLARLLKLRAPQPEALNDEDFETVSAVVRDSGRADAALAFLGDKQFLFNERRNALVMYGTHGKSWIALGDPVGPIVEKSGLAWAYKGLVEKHGGWTVFHDVPQQSVSLYAELGLTLFQIGENARVPLAAFGMEGARRRNLRREHLRAAHQGCTFEVLPGRRAGPLLPALRAVSDDWRRHRHTQEKGFSMGFFNEAHLRLFPVCVVRRRDGRVAAFASLLTTASSDEIGPDLVRNSSDAPRGVLEYLFVEILLWAKREKYRSVDLGLSAPPGIEAHPGAAAWSRLGAFVYRHGDHFRNFQELRRFKDKFDPLWEPRYLACPGGLALPHVLVDLTALIAGKTKGNNA